LSKIKEQVSPRSYTVETENGQLYRRNRQQIIKTDETFNGYYGMEFTNYDYPMPNTQSQSVTSQSTSP